MKSFSSPLLRRWFALLLIAALSLSLAACQSRPPAPGNPSEELPLQQEEDPAPEVSSPAQDEPAVEEEPVQEDPPEPSGQPDSSPSGQQEETPPASEKPQQRPTGENPMVALTFDDGPHREYTDQILDILEANGAKATFFEVGRNLYNDPDAVRRAESLGCEIGSHSYRHADLGKMSAQSIAEDLQKADAIFQEVLGHTPNLLRPPYGSLNDAVKYTTGRSIVTWSIDTEDWRSQNTDKIIASVQNAGDLSGQVILMHSTYATTVEAVRQLVPWLLEQGYQLVTITELITQYYGDQVLANGTYGYSYFKNGKDVILPPGQPEEPPQTEEQPTQPEEPDQPDAPPQTEEPSQLNPPTTGEPDTPSQAEEQPPQPETPPQAGASDPGESPAPSGSAGPGEPE